ncbi:putative toxin-antitoxin system toxin component, PIN family [Candidatus Marsarchaeota archaeon]|nr:putative toxin-antitoxin system toxin component, PIN family [Candidatus Marsarchaeota archaeon]
MGKRKVVLDTNILISALGWKGKPHRIMEMVASNELELFISDKQFIELSRVLNYPRLSFTTEQKSRFKEFILEIASFVKPTIKLDVIKDDPDDNMILECALVAGVDYIVSGDDHLLSIKKFGKIKILTADDFLNE